METNEKYLFRVSIDEEDYAVFAENAREAIDIAFLEVLETDDLMNIEVKLLCFENDIINLNDLLKEKQLNK